MSFNKKALVIGDLILDTYIIGEINRISPEAPVPVLLQKDHYNVLGGALNVARNLNNLIDEVNIIGIVGDDNPANSMFRLMDKDKISTKNIITDRTAQTSQKTRFVSNNQQLLRWDIEKNCFSKKNESLLEENIIANIKETDFIIISDYNKGVCSNLLIKKTIQSCLKKSVDVFIDPKGSDFNKYQNAFCITPNIKEAKAVYKSKLITNEDFEKACKYICDTYKIKTCVITRGKDGMTVFDSRKFKHIKSKARDVFDVSGAGDTVIATLATYYSKYKNLIDAAKIANIAAKKVISQFGTTPITSKDLNRCIK